MIFLPILVAIFAILAGYCKWIHTYWKRRGINGPTGLPILGSYYELADNKAPRFAILNKWTKQFGKVFGYYEGSVPVLVVSDLDMLQEMFIKKFDCFYARKSTNRIHGDLESPEEEPRIHLFAARGARWKRLRALASPAFSVKALKQVHSTIEDSVLEMIKHMEVNENSGLNIHEYFQEFTYDVISRLAMGQPESEIFKNEGVEIVKHILSRSNRTLPWYLTVVFPRFQNKIKNWFFNHESIRGGNIGKLFLFIEKSVKDRIKERAENSQIGVENPQNDFIDMFLDYYTESEIQDAEFGTSTIEKKVTAEDVIGSCFVFLLAGFDTTANALAYAAHLLVMNPDKMKLAQEEVDSVCTSPEISYDELTKLKYLEAVVKETLRMCPVGWFACSRECVKTTTLGDIVVEKGVRVEADVQELHFSKEIWGDNAEDFEPERWLTSSSSPPRHTMSWIPFGAGPRQCVGMRMGMAEAKLALAHVLRKWSLVAGPDTERELVLHGCTTTSPERVTVYLKARNTP